MAHIVAQSADALLAFQDFLVLPGNQGRVFRLAFSAGRLFIFLEHGLHNQVDYQKEEIGQQDIQGDQTVFVFNAFFPEIAAAADQQKLHVRHHPERRPLFYSGGYSHRQDRLQYLPAGHGNPQKIENRQNPQKNSPSCSRKPSLEVGQGRHLAVKEKLGEHNLIPAFFRQNQHKWDSRRPVEHQKPGPQTCFHNKKDYGSLCHSPYCADRRRPPGVQPEPVEKRGQGKIEIRPKTKHTVQTALKGC